MKLEKIEREIPKRIRPPSKLSDETVGLINDLLYDPPDGPLSPCEAVLIFGSSLAENHELIAETFRSVEKTLRPKEVFITGGALEKGHPTESEEIFRLMNVNTSSETTYTIEVSSRNTLENVLNAMKLGLHEFNDIFFIAKGPHCGRCRLTLERYLPDAHIRHKGYNPTVVVGNPPIERFTWHQHPECIELAWAELKRIEQYGRRGDIAFPADVQAKIERIHEIIGC